MELHNAIFQLPVLQLLSHLLYCPLVPIGRLFSIVALRIPFGRRNQQVQKLIFNTVPGDLFDFDPLAIADQSNSCFGEVTNDALNITTVVADFCVLGRFDLHKRRAG